MNIRQFASDDAEFCFKVRSKAFIEKFYGELTPETVAAAVNAAAPSTSSGQLILVVIQFYQIANN